MPTESSSKAVAGEAIERGDLVMRVPPSDKPALPNTSAALARLAAAELDAVNRLPEIEDEKVYELMIGRGQAAARMVVALDADRKSLVDYHVKEQRRINDAFRPALEAAEAAKSKLRALCGRFLDRKREEREKAERLAVEANRKAEEERRAALEQQEREAAERMKDAASAGNVDAALEAAADIDRAREDAALPLPAAHVPAAYTPAPKVAGSARRKKFVWSWADDATSRRNFIVEAVRRFQAGDASLMTYLEIDEAKISRQVTNLGADANLPGVVARESSSVAFRS